MKITILGAGAWGTAVAIALAKRHEVMLWGRSSAEVRPLIRKKENTNFFPGFGLPEELETTSEIERALNHLNGVKDNGLLIIATPVAGLRPTLQRIRRQKLPNLVWLCKGFEENTADLPHQIVFQELGRDMPCAVLSGPSFAREVAVGKPCALTVASLEPSLCDLVVSAIHNERMRIYSSDDVVGVEVGGAVKNIFAIGAGISDGLDLGTSARAALMTRGLAEMTRLGVALGARSETFMGLSGAGDLMLTCTGNLSRNRTVGLELAKGKTLEKIIEDLGHVAEGVNCARAVCAKAEELNVDMPIARAVSDILFNKVPPQDMVEKLMARSFKPERQ